jgi:zinc transporter, ZIP family
MVAAGGGTTLGVLVLLVWKTPSDRAFDLALAGSAGIMLAATVLGLLPAARAEGSVAAVVVGLALGSAVIAVADRLVPHIHARFAERDRDERDHDRFTGQDAAHPAGGAPRLSEASHRGVLLAAAIALHNFPEGMAVGIAFAAGGELGVALALAILVHNVPEGLAVALPLRAMGQGMGRTIWLTAATGLVEIAGALCGYALGSLGETLLPWGLSFAAGAMLYVVVDELVPAAHVRGEQRSSLTFLAAFCAMAIVMLTLGDLQRPA